MGSSALTNCQEALETGADGLVHLESLLVVLPQQTKIKELAYCEDDVIILENRLRIL